MIPIKYEIAPNLTVRVCQTEKLKAGMISLSVVLPIDREKTCLTSLLLSVLHRGTRTYPTIAHINRRLDYLFGTEMSVRNYYRGDRHIIGIAADLLGEEYLPDHNGRPLMEDVLEVMCEILFHPLLDEDGCLQTHYVESEKSLQCDAIRALKNHPRAYAMEHCSEILYQNEPCGVPIYGTEEQIVSVTAEQLTAHWRSLIEDLRLDCFYVGPNRGEVVCERIGRVFLPKITDAEQERKSEHVDVHAFSGEVKRVEEELAVSQGQLVMGFCTDTTVRDDDYYACVVANEMLGVSPISKLFVNVREKLGLCYHCSSHYNMYKGVVLITCGLHPKNRALAEREIMNQIDLLAKGDFSDTELFAAKQSLENAYRQLEDSPTALENYYLGRAVYGVDTTLAQCRERIASVTREDILRVAARLRADTVYFLNGTALADGEEAEDEAD